MAKDGLIRAARGRLSRALAPAVARAARHYVAGDRAEDAICVARALEVRSVRATVGYWNDSEEPAEHVEAEYAACLDALERAGLAGYLSIKLPALGADDARLDRVLARARGRRVHFDSLGPEHADRTFDAIERRLRAHPDLGCTLPGRWRRSVPDAAWAASKGVFVRVVKGQWGDPGAPERDARAGFLEVVEALAGRARKVLVATHDAALLERALARLGAAGTPTAVEVLHGLPRRRAVKVARRLRVPLRVYVPYGSSWLPYSLEQVRRRPALLVWALADRVGL